MKKATEAIPNILLRRAREQRGWLQEYVATAVGTTPVNVSRWEQGITQPSPRFRAKLCELFNMSPQELGLLAEDSPESDTSSADSLSSPYEDSRATYSSQTRIDHIQSDIMSPPSNTKNGASGTLTEGNDMRSLFNPYGYLTAIRDAQRFIGRTRLISRLYSAIADHQSASLVGTRHIGKSSVLQYIRLPETQRRFGFAGNSRKHIFVLMDFGQFLQKSSEDFFNAVNAQLVTQSKDFLTLTIPTEKGADSFTTLLAQINNQDFHPVLLLDEFDKITRNRQFDSSFFSVLRSQANFGRISYITASLAPLHKLLHNDIEGSPFFNIFGTYVLSPLAHEEARELITLPSTQARCPFTPREVEWIIKLAGRHPFFIQRICYLLFEEKHGSDVAEVDLDRARAQAYAELLPHFEVMWCDLDTPQQELLRHEAQRPETHQRELPELSESALFRAFVRQKCQLALFQMTKDDVERVLDKLDDIHFLAESNLRHLNIVTLRLKKESASSTIERGIAVREVLNEAFERLGGSGTRNDSAPEWRLYNILYYRYFKYHMKNEQVGARLGLMSRRHYYRERHRASEAFLQTILEMEDNSQAEQ